jgi:hypothetical protein
MDSRTAEVLETYELALIAEQEANAAEMKELTRVFIASNKGEKLNPEEARLLRQAAREARVRAQALFTEAKELRLKMFFGGGPLKEHVASSVADIEQSMTVGELIAELQKVDPQRQAWVGSMNTQEDSDANAAPIVSVDDSWMLDPTDGVVIFAELRRICPFRCGKGRP